MGNGAKAQQKRDRKGDDKKEAKSQLKSVRGLPFFPFYRTAILYFLPAMQFNEMRI
jgi:hypothetical protein